jgi:hypothetical protein
MNRKVKPLQLRSNKLITILPRNKKTLSQSRRLKSLRNRRWSNLWQKKLRHLRLNKKLLRKNRKKLRSHLRKKPRAKKPLKLSQKWHPLRRLL